MAHDNGASPKRLEKYEKALQIYKDSLVEQEPRPARHERGDASGFASGAGRAYRPQGIQPVPDVKAVCSIMASSGCIVGSADGSGRKCRIGRSLSNSRSALEADLPRGGGVPNAGLTPGFDGVLFGRRPPTWERQSTARYSL